MCGKCVNRCVHGSATSALHCKLQQFNAILLTGCEHVMCVKLERRTNFRLIEQNNIVNENARKFDHRVTMRNKPEM